MVAFNEAKKSKIEKILKEDNMEMFPGGPKKIIKSKTRINKGRKIIKEDPNQDIKIKSVPGFRSGGRAMYKSGSKGCKLAMKGKGRAYGKNS
tara:strand:+ start:45 stop:320 length:276 start_codon:yes stop_codon:yes gene_type:complete